MLNSKERINKMYKNDIKLYDWRIIHTYETELTDSKYQPYIPGYEKLGQILKIITCTQSKCEHCKWIKNLFNEFPEEKCKDAIVILFHKTGSPWKLARFNQDRLGRHMSKHEIETVYEYQRQKLLFV